MNSITAIETNFLYWKKKKNPFKLTLLCHAHHCDTFLKFKSYATNGGLTLSDLSHPPPIFLLSKSSKFNGSQCYTMTERSLIIDRFFQPLILCLGIFYSRRYSKVHQILGFISRMQFFEFKHQTMAMVFTPFD